MAKKKPQQPFDRRGGAVVISAHLIRSPHYLGLPPPAKTLMTLMQLHWRPFDPVAYGVKEAAEKIPCDKKTARKAFDILSERGFITCIEESYFSSRTQSRARTWRLEWMPFNDNPPRNTWEKVGN